MKRNISAKAAAQRKMKPSGVDWIGDVPEGWDIERVKYTGWYRNGLTYSPEDVCEEGEGTLVLRSSNIQDGRLDFEDVVFVGKIIPRELKTKLYDIIICSRNGSSDLIGKNALVDSEEPMTFGAFMMCYRPDGFAPRFAYWLLNSCVFKYYLSSFTTSTVNQLTGADFGNIKAPLPPLDEQKRIAAKLDRLCGRVDELAENLKGEIAALQEYRKSLITECVTKGLNPKAKMKPSGVDWIGDVPEEWTVMRTRYLVSITTGDHDTQDADETGEYPLYVRSPIVERSQRYTFEGPGVLMAGDGAGAGRIFHLVDGKYAVHQRVYRLYNFNEISQTFLWLWLQSFFPIIMDHGSAQSTVPSVRLPMLKNLIVALPTMKEQREIAAFLNKRCAVLDAKIAERQRQLEKLGEYRSSVIYEYVTGKKEVSA